MSQIIITTSRFGPFTAPNAAAGGDTVSGAEHCVSCDRPAGAAYCAHCGERRAADRPVHVRELVEELWGEFAAVDGRVVRSFWTLLRRPGALTAAYARGERRRYLTPLKLFLSTNVLFFLTITRAGANSVLLSPLGGQLDGAPSGAVETLIRHLVETRVAARHVTLAAYTHQFNAAAAAYTHSLIIALAPVFAACVALAVFPNRRPLLHHLAFALHTLAIVFLLAVGVFYTLLYGVGYTAPPLIRALVWVGRLVGVGPARGTTFTISLALGDAVVLPIVGLLVGTWLAVALRRVYGGSRTAAVARAAALLGCLIPMVVAYRVALFFVTYWAT